MTTTNDVNLPDFCEKLDYFRNNTLTDPQKTLLDKILSFAWNATATEEDLDSGFKACFDQDQARLILAYSPPGASDASGETVLIARLIMA